MNKKNRGSKQQDEIRLSMAVFLRLDDKKDSILIFDDDSVQSMDDRVSEQDGCACKRRKHFC